jgi:ABC-type multidrug transport system permease subunit
MTSDVVRPLWALVRKDLGIWIRQPANVMATVAPPLMFLLVEYLGAAAVGRSPVALVQLDRGANGAQMAQIIHDADVFRLTDVATQAQAEALLRNLSVVAAITIPSDFSERVAAGQPAPIDVEVNNLNLDFTNDIRRSVPDAITQFYAAQGSSSPIKVTMQERDLRARDVDFVQYDVLPTIILLLMLGGLVSSGLATAREWESRTAKELLLAPVARGVIVGGKVLAGFVTTFGLGLMVLGLGYALGWTRPEGVYWLSTLLIVALVALLSAALGVALGALVQRIQPVTTLAIVTAIYLFFLGGGVGVLAFDPDWLQAVSAFIPLSYGTHALQMAVFYSSADRLAWDALVLIAMTLAALLLGLLAMRRSIAH